MGTSPMEVFTVFWEYPLRGYRFLRNGTILGITKMILQFTPLSAASKGGKNLLQSCLASLLQIEGLYVS